MFLAWFDDDKKRPASHKLAAAIRRYDERHGRLPTVALVNPDQFESITPPPNIELRPARTVGFNCFWVGDDETEEGSL